MNSSVTPPPRKSILSTTQTKQSISEINIEINKDKSITIFENGSEADATCLEVLQFAYTQHPDFFKDFKNKWIKLMEVPQKNNANHAPFDVDQNDCYTKNSYGDMFNNFRNYSYIVKEIEGWMQIS